MNISFKGIAIIAIFLISFIGSNFVSADSTIPLTKEEVMLNHIMSAANCNELEAGLLLAIMCNHSVFHDGFDFYLDYLEGDPVAKDKYDKSVRFRDYYIFWEDLLHRWSGMSLDEKAKLLNVETGTAKSTQRIFDEMDANEASYVIDGLAPFIDDLTGAASKANDISEARVDDATDVSDDIGDSADKFYNAVGDAHLKYLLSNVTDMNYDDALPLYESESQAIYYNDSLSNRTKMAELQRLERKYTSKYDSLTSAYNSMDNVRKLINIRVGVLLGTGSGCVCAGISLTVAGANMLISAAATVGVSAIPGGIVLAIGIALIVIGCVLDGVGGALSHVDTIITDTTNKLNDYKSKLEYPTQLAVGYIETLIRTLN